jgi:hypothetical protein
MPRVVTALGLVVLAFSVAQAAYGRGRLAGRHDRAYPVPAFQWLVPTTGPQLTIAQENRNMGTMAWRLRGPSAEVGGLA